MKMWKCEIFTLCQKYFDTIIAPDDVGCWNAGDGGVMGLRGLADDVGNGVYLVESVIYVFLSCIW